MPKLCEGCGFYAADNAPSKCPNCDGALKFTFLPPAGKDAAPVRGLATDPLDALGREKRASGQRVNWLLVKAIGVTVVVAVGMIVRFAVRQDLKEEARAAEKAGGTVRVGMHISEAARILDAGAGTHVPGTTRLRDRYDADDDSDGEMTIEDGRHDLVVKWRDGYVTSVAPIGGDGETTAGGGTRKRVTRATGPAGDDDDTAPGGNEVVHPAERVVAPPGGRR